MSERDNGGYAFPSEQGHVPDGTWNQTWDPGMTLRDWFAGQALAGMMGIREWVPEDGEDKRHLAERCYEQADAMLKAREQ